MPITCMHCETDSVFTDEYSQEQTCHNCGTVTKLYDASDVYTNVIDPNIRSTISQLLHRINSNMDTDEYVNDAQHMYNTFRDLSCKEACLLAVCAARPTHEQLALCSAVGVNINRLRPCLSSSVSHETMYSDIVFRYMKELAQEYRVFVKYPTLTTVDYVNPKKMALIQLVKQHPKLKGLVCT